MSVGFPRFILPISGDGNAFQEEGKEENERETRNPKDEDKEDFVLPKVSLGIRHRSRNSSAMNPGFGRSQRAFTFVALLMIVAVLAILVAMLLPALAKAKQRARRTHCMSNLKHDGMGFRMWTADHDDAFPMRDLTNGTAAFVADGNVFRHFQVMSNELSTPKILVCPTDTRKAATKFEELSNRNISYFVGLDADLSRPQMFLTGDRNITNGLSPIRTVLRLPARQPAGWTAAMHNGEGNIALSDSSVQVASTPRLREMIKTTGDETNRIALPE